MLPLHSISLFATNDIRLFLYMDRYVSHNAGCVYGIMYCKRSHTDFYFHVFKRSSSLNLFFSFYQIINLDISICQIVQQHPVIN